jgi:hypothetical protein
VDAGTVLAVVVLVVEAEVAGKVAGVGRREW